MKVSKVILSVAIAMVIACFEGMQGVRGLDLDIYDSMIMAI